MFSEDFTRNIICNLTSIGADGERAYERTLCGSTSENTASTIEICDVDMNARFYLDNDMVTVEPSGNFLYHVIVSKEKKADMDKKVLLMQQHPRTINVDGKIIKEKQKSIAKSYIEKGSATYLSSHVAFSLHTASITVIIMPKYYQSCMYYLS